MKEEKVQEVIDTYRKMFEEHGVGKAEHPYDKLYICPDIGLEHCHGMLDKMEQFIVEDRLDKVFRWLGFIQGVLWSQRVYTLTDLMNHNRADST